MRKGIQILVSTLLSLTLLAGCGTQPSTESSATPEASASTSASASASASESAAPASEAPLKIRMIEMGGPKTVDSVVEKEIEKRYNVDLDIVFMPAWDEMAVKTNLLMSDPATMPDVIQFTGMDKEFAEWKEAGLIVDLQPYLKENGKEILSYYSKETLFYSYEDGHIFKLPGDVAEASSGTIVMRGDWLKKLGLPAPKTTDEFRNTMLAFTNDDPDGNGVKDTYGLGNIGMVYAAFKTNPDGFLIGDDGKVGYGAIMPGMRDALAYLHDLYAAGAIDPSLFTGNDWQKEIERWTGGKVGCMSHGIHHFNPASSLNKAFYANNAGAEMISVDPITGPGGFAATDVQDVGGWCHIAVTTNAKDPARVVAFLNELCKPEGFALYKFGIEGTHYEIKDGVFNPLMGQDELNAQGVNLLSWYLERKDGANIQNTTQVVDMFKRNLELSKPMRDITVIFKDKNRPVWSEYAGDLTTLRDTVVQDIILGNKDITAFDAFVTQWLAQGGDKVLEEANALYQRQLEDLAGFDAAYESLVK